MEIADNPKMDLIGLQENMATTTTTTAQKISVVDHINGFHYAPERSDNFVIDMEESYSNPRITLQRNFSRKGSYRGAGGGYGGSEKKVNSNGSVSKEKESAAPAASSPGAGSGVGGGERGLLLGSSTPEKGTADGQGHHQITITSAAGSIKATTAVEGRSPMRRSSFKRHQSSWLLDPRKVLFFFATLSSLGTLLLIYFTLSIASVQSDDAAALE